MYRASDVNSLDVLPPSLSHFPHGSKQYSQQDWPASNLQASAYGVDWAKSHRSHQQSEQGGPLRYSACETQPGSGLRNTDRKLEGLHTPPSENMTTSYHVQHQQQQPQYDRYGQRESSHRHQYATYPVGQSSSQHTSMSEAGSVTSSNANATVASSVTANTTHNVITPSLQIPTTINNSGGSLPEFAASITCLFWFETTDTLRIAEDYQKGTPFPLSALSMVREARPTTAFAKWAVTVLSITQVSQSVTLLALLFIYRLKTLNPAVKGRPGSEYRLLTVALMLGNKFLDDNTYTNKTWAEVSGISVAEIHVMEVEFLSNMRYSLLATSSQWKEWQSKLANFADFLESFGRALSSQATLPPLPSGQLPSPSSIQASPPRSSNILQCIPQPHGHSQWQGQYSSGSLPPVPDLYQGSTSSRKRSLDFMNGEEPPAKRSHLEYNAPLSSGTRLPVPNLAVSTQALGSNRHNLSQNVPLLPPISSRSNPTVYPTTPAYTPMSHGSVTPTVQLTHNMYPTSQHGTPSRRTSPHSVHDLMSLNASPVSGSFPHGHALVHSPSIYLQQRSSPYKPVRPPHTLLHPPPSGALQGYSGGHEQMHYQPLGRRNDYRTGVVPDYTHPPYLHQHQHWAPLPQPNFYR